MNDISEQGLTDFPLDRTLYIDTNISKNIIIQQIENFIK